ncbi:bpX6 domain-containing protein [Kribbella sp. NPDC023855]|uniref:bpX6 domain-containing protein n=1 Tax=Kribbella sp. NPDC023855 TaxID=3154698 RepID=UPI0033FD7284
MTAHVPFRGTTLAAALLFDVPTIGPAEARRRVLTHWQPGSTLRALPDGSWLLTLPEPVPVRAERAPGLPLTRTPTGWSTQHSHATTTDSPASSESRGGSAAASGGTDTITLPIAGETVSIAWAATQSVDTSTWVDLSSLTIHHLKPLDRAPETAEVPVEAITTPPPDLRGAAHVGRPTKTAEDFRDTLDQPPHHGRFGFTASRGWPGLAARRGWRNPASARAGWATGSPEGTPPSVIRLLWILASLAGLVLVVCVVMLGTADDLLHTVRTVALIIVLGVLIRRFKGSSGAAGRPEAGAGASPTGQPSGPGLLRRLWSTMIRRSPAGHFVNRAQQRYLEELTRRFEQRDFDQALRDAIGLNGPSIGRLRTLRLPQPRTSLTPGSTSRGIAAEFGDFPTTYERLEKLYLDAARELERTGRPDQAAFVYADLLNDTRAAVDVLERHDRLRLAAQLAENQELEAALVIRLWWRAGDRDRAVDFARRTGAFATGIERLHRVDAEQAQELRRAWIQYCRDAGDPVAAVEAAWPDADLRSSVVPDIAAGMAMGGPRAAQLFAYLATEYPTPENIDRAVALLESDDAEARQRFTFALVALRSTDRAQDKRLASAALRSLLRAGATDDNTARRAIAVLRDRCDPLLRADLPRVPMRSSSRGKSMRFTLDDGPGGLPVHDAAALRGGAVLVAHGDHGVRLLTHDGRTRASWDLPVHSLVVADHGGTALLVTRSDSLQTIHRLDLATRTIRRWTTLPPWHLLPSYDGGLVTVIDETGLAFVDTLSSRPRTVWRELDPQHGVVAINRTPDLLTAVVTVMPANSTQEPQLQLLRWQLPSMTLRVRRNLPRDILTESQALLPDRFVVADGDSLTSYDRNGHPTKRELLTRWLASSGKALAYLGQVEGDPLTIEYDGRQVARVDQATSPHLRDHDGLLALGTLDGRIAVIDPAGPQVLANFRTRH